MTKDRTILVIGVTGQQGGLGCLPCAERASANGWKMKSRYRDWAKRENDDLFIDGSRRSSDHRVWS